MTAQVLSMGWGIVGVAAGTLVPSLIYFTTLTVIAPCTKLFA